MDQEFNKTLSQEELKNIYDAQRAKNWSIVQDNQLRLKSTLVKNYEDNWARYKNDHPNIKPVFDVKNSESQEIIITKNLAEKYNLLGHLAEFDKKSDNSTAGIRAFYDMTHSENPGMMFNDLFMALLIAVDAEFLESVHTEIKEKLDKIEKTDPGLINYIARLKTLIKPEDLKIIEEIYGMSFDQIIPYTRENIIKLVGGEVRAHTAKFVEMETRILAARGITVIVTENYTDTIPIYMHSFLTFILGAAGSTNYTSSHSSNYLFGRKFLAYGGGQLLPDKYQIYRDIIKRIVEQDIVNGTGFKITIAESSHSGIRKTLTYEKMVKLYRSILNVTEEDVTTINQATKEGHKIILSCLNGATWKTLSPLLDHLKIDKKIFDLVYENEDRFFDIGYVVSEEKKADGSLKYSVDHLGADVTMSKIAATIPYRKILGNSPLGRKLYECDPDSDRFCMKQVVENNPQNQKIIEEFGLDNYRLSDDQILVAPSPNKMFLMLDAADYERMREQGVWNDFYSIYIITYVSTRAWAEFGDAVPNMVKVMARVGYKNLTEMQQLIEAWYFGKVDQQTFEFSDQLGNRVKLNRDKKIRVHSKEEESGGRVSGMNNDCFNIYGEKTLAMPEKSAPDSLLSELTLSSKLFLASSTKMDGEYRILEMIKAVFDRYNLRSKIDSRIDLLHGDQGTIAMMSYKEQQEALIHAGDIKTNFNNFFFSLGKAVKEKKAGIEKVGEILSKAIPKLSDTWTCLESMTLSEEPISGGRLRPEGVPMVFDSSKNANCLVTELDFRPSGTDPLKSKVYIDAEKLQTVDKDLIEEELMNLTEYNLYDILKKFEVESIEKRSKSAEGLKKLEI